MTALAKTFGDRASAAPQPRVPMREVAWGAGEVPRPCPVCGQEWQPFCGSKLACHARCLFTESDASDIRAMYSVFGVTMVQLQAYLGGIPLRALRAVLETKRRAA